MLGGDLRALIDLRLRWVPVAVVGAVLRYIGGLSLGLDAQRAAHAGALWLVGIAALANLSVRGAALIAIGVLANAFTLTLNGGQMPVSLDAAELARGCRCVLGTDFHQEMTALTHLNALADTIPLPLARNVYSIGDLASAAGVIVVIASAMRRSRTTR